MSAHHLRSQVFGPNFYNRVTDICDYEELFGDEGLCLKWAEDNKKIGGYDPISSNILLHYMQIINEGRF